MANFDNRRATTLMLPSYWPKEQPVIDFDGDNLSGDPIARGIVLTGKYGLPLLTDDEQAEVDAEADDCSLCNAAFGTCTC